MAHKRSKNSDVESSNGDDRQPATAERLTVVGIGASAGGLNALQRFFDTVPDATGMAFVVVTHLHPEHESHLAELLQSRTKMPVRQVTERTAIMADHVYVIPPNRGITVTDSHLEVAAFVEAHGHRTPIDDFFRTLAQKHEGAAAIILSGSGTDGAVGIKSIKEAGGLLLVQDPDEAEYDGMPVAAIRTGVVDAVLPVGELASKLVDYRLATPDMPLDAESLSDRDVDIIQRILAQVRARTGHDFSQYKRSTILRRIQRRLQLNGLSRLDEYLEYLRANPLESSQMFNDILIGVTNFFRDPAAWEALKKNTIPALFQGKAEGDAIRVWSVGCATGEEAYSLAILLSEHAATLDSSHEILVFASDLDDTSLARAREGTYPSSIEADVSRARLDTYFTQQGTHYQVKREMREMILFTNHSILRDPPFSRIDLIVCRNVLIYLQREIQENLFDIFHYALNPGGFLFLGSSESAETAEPLFEPVDKAQRIYLSRPWHGEHPHVPTLPLTVRRGARTEILHPRLRTHRHAPQAESVTVEEQHRLSLETYGPPTILVNSSNGVLHVSETAGRYLLQQRGAVTAEILKLVRPELQTELRSALFHAFDKNKVIVSRPVTVKFDGHSRNVTLSVRPRAIPDPGTLDQERQALVVFLEDELEGGLPDGTGADGSAPARDSALVNQLESEVHRLREQLQATVEEFDSSNEEMKAANEELQSINEEYRSATEELETGKEELQSVNEELQAMNHELKAKLEEISRAHNDLENLMASSSVATLFLDRDLRIERYNPGISGLFNIVPTDKGRSITHLTHHLAYEDLVVDAGRVLKDLETIEREVSAEGGRWFLVRLRPYRTLDDRIEGVVVTLTDITRLKDAEQKALRLNELLETRVKDRTRELNAAVLHGQDGRSLFDQLFHSNPAPTALFRRDDQRFLMVNQTFLDAFHLRSEDVIGKRPEDLGFRWPGTPQKTASALLRQLDLSGPVTDLELQGVDPSGASRTILASFRKMVVDETDAVLAAFTDITERKRNEMRVRDVLDATPDPIVMIDRNGRIVLVNAQIEAVFGYKRSRLIGQPFETLIPDGSSAVQRMSSAPREIARPMGGQESFLARRSDGTELPVEVSLSRLGTEEGTLVIAAVRDISERVGAEAQIRDLASKLMAAEQRERRRISQVLHDDLQQRLFAIRASLLILARQPDTPSLPADLSQLGDELTQSIQITRELSSEISPIVLAGQGLIDATTALAEEMKDRYGLSVEVLVDAPPATLEENLRITLFQCVRELLFNIVKHARTSKATVRFGRSKDHVRIAVQDEGAGFDPTSIGRDTKSGYGLLGIQRRLGLVGCAVQIHSEPGKGTTIEIDVKTEKDTP